PGQSAGGAKSNVCASNPMNVNAANSGTTQGSVAGGGITGAATATCSEPIGRDAPNPRAPAASAGTNAHPRQLRMASTAADPLAHGGPRSDAGKRVFRALEITHQRGDGQAAPFHKGALAGGPRPEPVFDQLPGGEAGFAEPLRRRAGALAVAVVHRDRQVLGL